MGGVPEAEEARRALLARWAEESGVGCEPSGRYLSAWRASRATPSEHSHVRTHRVIGVEISPLLAEIARDGLASRSREHRCGDVEVVVCDASKYRVPDDLTIGYFFNPFYGETLDTVLRNIVGSIDRRPRRVRLIYVDPVFGRQILATGRFRLEKWLRGGLRDRRLSRAAIFESC